MEWPSYCLYLPLSPLNYALRWTAPFIAHSSTVAIVLQTPTCIMLKFDIIDWINEDRSFNKRIDRLSERIDRIREDRSINERIDRISEDRSFSQRIDRLSERIDRIREDRSITKKKWERQEWRGKINNFSKKKLACLVLPTVRRRTILPNKD